MVSNRLSLLVIFVLTLLVTSCQDNPVSPDAAGDTGITTSDRTTESTHRMNLGSYLIELDTENLTATPVPLRTSELHLNLTKIFVNTMGISLAVIPGESDPPNGLFAIDFTFTHPLPIHPQFSIFDVKGILMSPGSLAIGSMFFADVDETRLENADGYTRWWNPTEFTDPGVLGYTDGLYTNTTAANLTASVNPYKHFADVLGATDGMGPLYNTSLANNVGRGVFRYGSVNTRRYLIQFPMDPGPVIVFGYVIDGSWDIPDPDPPGEVPDDFPIEANQPEAFYIALADKVNTLYYDSESGVGGGVLRLQANVHDWQGLEAGLTAPEIDIVRIFSPDLMGSGVTASFLDETINNARYTADLTGLAVPTQAGEVLIAVKAGSAGGPEYGQGLGTAAPASNVSAWQTMVIDIPDPVCTSDGNNDFAEAVEIQPGIGVKGQVCQPDDYRDYYYFEIPPGYAVSGEIRIYSDAGPTIITLYDDLHIVLVEETTSSVCVLPLDDLSLLPGIYYISIATDITGDIRPYFLEPDGEMIDVNPCGAVEVTPDTLLVDAYHVFMHGNYAFLVGKVGIWVFDVTDPGNPVQISYVETIGAMYADFQYPYCYGIRYSSSSSENQLDMVDFSDPYNPMVHADLVYYTDSVGPAICMDEQYLYIQHEAAPDHEIQIFDYASNPTSPTLVTDIDTTLAPRVMAVTEIPTYGKYLVVGGYLELWAYSIENLGSILEVPPYSFTGSTAVTRIACNDETIYVIHRTGTWDHFLYTMQLDSFGTSLVYYDNIDLTFAAYSILLDEPYLYLGEDDGLSVFDVSIPTAPVIDNSYEMIAFGASLDLSGDTLCVIPGRSGLEFFNVADPTSPVHYPNLLVCNKPYDMAVNGNYLFTTDRATNNGAVLTLDISDPANTFVAASFTPPGEPDFIDADGTNLLITYYDGVQKWMLLDTSDPLNLSEITIQVAPDPINSIKLTADAVYIGTSFPEVHVFDYSVIPPVNTVGIMLADDPQELTTGLDHLYVTTTSGIEILSLTDPLSPGYEGTYTPFDYQYFSEVAGDYLYIAGDSTLEVASLADPSNPVFEGSLEVTTIYDLTELAIDGQYVFVTGYETPIYAIQRLPVDAPSFSCYIHELEDYSCEKLIAHEGFLYEMNEYGGVQIYDLY